MKSCILMLCFLVCFRSSWSKDGDNNPPNGVPGKDGSDGENNQGDNNPPNGVPGKDGSDGENKQESSAEANTNITTPTSGPTTTPNMTTLSNASITIQINATAPPDKSKITNTNTKAPSTSAQSTTAAAVTTKKHSGGHRRVSLVERMQKLIAESSNKNISFMINMLNAAAKSRLSVGKPTDVAENVTPSTTVSIGQTTSVQNAVSQGNGTATPPNSTTPPITTEAPNPTEAPSHDDPETDTAGDTDLSNAGQPKPGKDGSDEKNNQGPKPLSRTPDSSHFAVVFLVMIALLFGLYALYHNRQKIIAVVVEGRSINGRGGRERYRKLDSESGLEPEARIKNSNEVYVY